jgi:hypothetical protein
MDGMAKHASPDIPEKSSAKVAAWSVLVTMGGTSVTLNIWDATHAAHLYPLLAVLKGLAPVLAAMLLSEAGARFDGGKAFRCVAFGIMAGAMVLSASAVATVLRSSYPAGLLGLIMSWLFGIVLDAAALTGLWIVLTERERRREAAREAGAAQSEAEQARREAGEAAGKAAGLEAELERVRAALEAERAKRVPGRKPRRGSARKPARTSAPVPVPAEGGSSAPEDVPDIDAEARILALIDEGYSASKAGVLAGKSDSYGRQVARLRNAAKKEPAGEDRTDGDMATGEQPTAD